MRKAHYLLLMALLCLATIGQSQTYIFNNTDNVEEQQDSDITLSIETDQPTNELKLALGGYLQESIEDVKIMTQVGISVQSWESLETKEAVLDITDLDRQKPYILHLKTSSGEIIIEKFVKV